MYKVAHKLLVFSEHFTEYHITTHINRHLDMQLPITTLLAAALVAVDVSALAIYPNTSPNPLVSRQGTWWGKDECDAVAGGSVAGGSTLWMLRNTWNNHFNGDFGGSLGVCSYVLRRRQFLH